MSDNVTHLKGLSPLTSTSSADFLIKHTSEFLRENEILVEWSYDDVDLEPARGDEIRLGKLTGLECDAYVLSVLLEQIVNDEMIELEASSTDLVARLMRQHKVSSHIAVEMMKNNPTEYMDNDQSALVSRVIWPLHMTRSLFEFSVRHRFDEWRRLLIVRTGFVVHSYENG
jgi:hypothetical protein